MNCRCYLSLVMHHPKHLEKHWVPATGYHCQEQMETPSIIPNGVFALPHAWAAPSAAQHYKATAWSRCSQQPCSAAALPASDELQLGAEGARDAMPEGTRADSCSSTALFHEKEWYGCPKCFWKVCCKKKIGQMLFTLRGEWNSNTWEDIKKNWNI